MTMTFEGAKQGVDSVQEAVSRESKEYVLAYHEAECERLKAQHKLITKHMQSNFSAPILADLQKGIKVLDAGCGPGAWTCEMAEMYPASTFHGIDLNPVFPRNGQPKNVRFDVAKIGEPLAFPDNTFQLVHQRLVAIGLSAADWDVALKEHIRVLQPGGWLELNEGDLEAQNMGPKTHMLIRAYLEMTRSRNLIPLIARELKERLEKLQMRNVTEICVTMLMNDENDGQLTLWDCLAPAFQNMQPYLSKMNTAFEDNDYFAKYLKEVGDECREYKTTIRMHRVFGQKP